jgi:hypothetical protein
MSDFKGSPELEPDQNWEKRSVQQYIATEMGDEIEQASENTLRVVRRKVDINLIPLLALLFLCSFLCV